jgi:hypothetical protein
MGQNVRSTKIRARCQVLKNQRLKSSSDHGVENPTLLLRITTYCTQHKYEDMNGQCSQLDIFFKWLRMEGSRVEHHPSTVGGYLFRLRLPF